jgi:hypothetical protein
MGCVHSITHFYNKSSKKLGYFFCDYGIDKFTIMWYIFGGGVKISGSISAGIGPLSFAVYRLVRLI